jgi:hypothetical protein
MAQSPRICRIAPLTSPWLWGAAYSALLVAIVVGLFQVRNWSTETFDNDHASQEWQEWREDVMNQPPDAPVSRRVPKSTQPPALVLLHDHFWSCMVISIVLSSALYFTFMLTVRGVLTSPGMIHHDEK